MEPLIYTLVRGADWRAAEAAGAYQGSADDRRDGFLHFSTASQLRASAAKHRAGEADLWMVEADAAALGDSLRWEPAAGGSRPGLFPHLYAPLPVSAVRRAVSVPLGADGLHAFPAGIP
ncbi:MAG: glutathione S-transferase [Rubritepida sp.]|nr:glutathione S-transferase [Rubritepida sp.]